MKALILALIIIACPSSSAFAGKSKLTLEGWLEKRYAQLKAVVDPAKVKVSTLDQSEDKDKDGFYRMGPKKGLVKFADGSWILLTSHSAHADDGVPDISLIRTSTGQFYYNRGHCCLPIILLSPKKVESLQDFLQTTGKGGNRIMTKWIKYSEQGGADQPATAVDSKSKGKKKPKQESEARSQ